VEHYCRTADEYYKQLPRPNALLHKPFTSLVEASEMLTRLGPLLEGLRLGKKMTVLDFGAGTCWLSHFLALLDCRTICLDVSETALQLGERLFREWPSLDEPTERPQFLPFNGRRIDLPDGSVERVVCFEALHHVPNVQEVLSEIYRVLSPGGIAGFAEPGEHHSECPFSQAEMLNHDVLELDVVIADVWEMAQHLGFSDIRFRLFSSPKVDMSFEERNALTTGEMPRHVLGHISLSMSQWSIFFLHKGEALLDSRGTAGLRGEINILQAPATVPSGQPFEMRVRCTNTGEAVWLGPEAYQQVGSVRIGPHLYDRDMRLITFDMPRHLLPRRMLPGESCDEDVCIGPLPTGDYIVAVDLVAELVAWFEMLGTVPPKVTIRVR
jgi:SAM-dependent methyltransferase